MTQADVDLTGKLAMIVPSLGRPGEILEVVDSWRETGADEGDEAQLVVAQHMHEINRGGAYELPAEEWISHFVSDTVGMVASLNAAALWALEHGATYIGFAGDDHRPRTPRWDADLAYALDALVADHGVGVVYGDDLMRHREEATAFVVSRSWVATLGRLVPAIVSHLYSDTSVRVLAEHVGALAYLPDVVIEHLHPQAGKRPWDDQTRAVNSRAQYAADGAIYRRWLHRPANTDKATGMRKQGRMLAALRPAAAGGES